MPVIMTLSEKKNDKAENTDVTHTLVAENIE